MNKGLTRASVILFSSICFMSAQAAETDFMGTASIDYSLPSDSFWDSGYGATFKARAFQPNKIGAGISAGYAMWDVENQNAGDFNRGAAERVAIKVANTAIRAENEARGFDPITLSRASQSEGVFAVPFVNSANISSIMMSGDVNLFPIGVSAYYKPIEKNGLSVVFEGGVRYVVVDSGVDLDMTFDTGNKFIAESNLRAEQVRQNNAQVRTPSSRIRERVKMDDGVVGVLGFDVIKQVARDVSLFCGVDYMFDIDEIDIDGAAKQLIEDISMESFSVHFGVGIRY